MTSPGSFAYHCGHMTSVAGQDYPKLLAPKADGELLISPEPRQLLRQTWENNQRFRQEAGPSLLGVPLGRARGWLRRWLGHREDISPIIATGHQTELYHPGVWVKNAVIDSIARRVGGQAIHFAVDTDAPKHLVYHWPGGGLPITDDPNLASARWSGLLKSPSLAHVHLLRQEATEASKSWGYQPAWDDLFDKLEEVAGKDVDLSSAITNAQHATDRGLGLHHEMLVSSTMWRSTAYLLFAYDLCARANQFAKKYNAALAEFRVRHGIVSPGRPMPDLNVESEWCESPFWLDDLAEGDRKRASLVLEEGRWTLNAGDARFAFDPSVKDGWTAAEGFGSWLGQNKLRLSPRALTLTMFLRMVLVDQFVHGIGGALYDQVTDTLITSWYGCPPPAFSVATATLYLPQAEGRERTCVECLSLEGRRLRDGALGERKTQLIREIQLLPRRSTQRAMLYSQMHRELDDAVQVDPRIADFMQRFEQARQRYSEDQLFFNRELPYTVQSRERLERLISRIDRLMQA
jgi:hypothetical protein